MLYSSCKFGLWLRPSLRFGEIFVCIKDFLCILSIFLANDSDCLLVTVILIQVMGRWAVSKFRLVYSKSNQKLSDSVKTDERSLDSRRTSIIQVLFPFVQQSVIACSQQISWFERAACYLLCGIVDRRPTLSLGGRKHRLSTTTSFPQRYAVLEPSAWVVSIHL